MSDRKRNWLLFSLGLCVHTQLVGHLDWYWGWLSAILLLGAVGYGFKQNVLSGPSTIRKETIGQIIDSLPDSLSVGTQSHREVLQRVLHMWEEFETMTLILDRILEGVVLVSSSGEVLLVNQRASNLIAVQPHQDITLLDLPNKGRKLIRTTLEGIEGEVSWFVDSKPKRQYIELVGLPIDNGGAIFVVRDITKIRNLERVRRDFIANISHELRTPITTILMNVEALMDLEGENPFVQAIHRNSDRLSLLVNGLLDLSRIEAGEMELTLQRLRLKPIVERVCGALESRARSKSQHLQIEIEDSAIAVVDAQSIEQILTNLVTNAIKYSPEEANITIRVYDLLEEERLMIEVEDDGQGVSAKHQRRLFERFYRVDKGRSRDEGGTGLGLAIVKHLVDAMGGEVGFRDADPHGSIFWVRLNVVFE